MGKREQNKQKTSKFFKRISKEAKQALSRAEKQRIENERKRKKDMEKLKKELAPVVHETAKQTTGIIKKGGQATQKIFKGAPEKLDKEVEILDKAQMSAVDALKGASKIPDAVAENLPLIAGAVGVLGLGLLAMKF